MAHLLFLNQQPAVIWWRAITRPPAAAAVKHGQSPDVPCTLRRAQILVIEGLHPFYDERVRDLLDFKIYLDISDDVKFAWKLQVHFVLCHCNAAGCTADYLVCHCPGPNCESPAEHTSTELPHRTVGKQQVLSCNAVESCVLQRDMAERGHSEESIKASIEARKPDFDAYIDPQKKNADVIIQVRA